MPLFAAPSQTRNSKQIHTTMLNPCVHMMGDEGATIAQLPPSSTPTF